MKDPIFNINTADQQRLIGLAADFDTLIKDVQNVTKVTRKQASDLLCLALLYDMEDELQGIHHVLKTGQN